MIRSSERGAVTAYFVVFTVLVLGFMVMAVDVGRLFAIQAELQAAADSAALSAAQRLNGTLTSTTRGTDQISAVFDTTSGNDNRFNLRMNPIAFGGTNLAATLVQEFFPAVVDALSNVNGGSTGGVDWSTGFYPKHVRVQLSAQAPVTFVPFLNRDAANLPVITVAAVAGISAPMCSVCAIDALAVVDASAGSDTDHYGFVPGDYYTLYLTTSQQTPNAPATPAALTGTAAAVEYVLLNHVPRGPEGVSLDGLIFELAAGGLSNAPDLTPPGTVTIDTVETAYTDLVGSVTAPVGQSVLCGLNVRFAVDITGNVCATLAGGEFTAIAPSYAADTDPGSDLYAAGVGLQDFASEYDGTLRRVLTVPVVDAADTLLVLNFRQFLLEVSPTVAEGVDPSLVTGAFRAQYLGAPVPIRCGRIGGACRVTLGVGKTVLH